MRTRQPVSQYMASSLSIQFSNSGCCFYESCGNRSPHCCSSTPRPTSRTRWRGFARSRLALTLGQWLAGQGENCESSRARGAHGGSNSRLLWPPSRTVPSLRGAHAKDSLRLLRHLDRDLLRLVLRRLRNMEGQYAILQVGADLLTVNPVRQREGAGEVSKRALIGKEVLTLVALLFLAETAHGQPISGQAHFDVLLLDPGNICFENERVLCLFYLELWSEGRQGAGDKRRKRCHLPKRIPARQIPHDLKRIQMGKMGQLGGGSANDVCHGALLNALGFWCAKSASSSAQQFVCALTGHSTIRKFKRDTSQKASLPFWWSRSGRALLPLSLERTGATAGCRVRSETSMNPAGTRFWRTTGVRVATSAEMKKIAKT